MSEDRIILGDELLNKLIGLYVIPLTTRRVVIDATWRETLTIYVEQTGTKRLLEVVPTLEGVKIQIVGQEEDA